MSTFDDSAEQNDHELEDGTQFDEANAGDLEQEGIIKTIKSELFSNPFKDLWGYFKRLWRYLKLTFVQFRNPAFSLDDNAEFTVKKQGVFYPIFFRFLNPLGTTGKEKIDQLDNGYIAYAKESVSLLIFTILLQLAFRELAGKETSGNLEVAFLNGFILAIYFVSVVLFAVVGRFLTRKVEDRSLARTIQESFVYEATMIFGVVVMLMTFNAFGLISLGEFGGLFALMTLSILFHPLYFLRSLTRRIRITNFVGVFVFSIVLGVIGMFTLMFAVAFSLLAAKDDTMKNDGTGENASGGAAQIFEYQDVNHGLAARVEHSDLYSARLPLQSKQNELSILY